MNIVVNKRAFISALCSSIINQEKGNSKDGKQTYYYVTACYNDIPYAEYVHKIKAYNPLQAYFFFLSHFITEFNKYKEFNIDDFYIKSIVWGKGKKDFKIKEEYLAFIHNKVKNEMLKHKFN